MEEAMGEKKRKTLYHGAFAASSYGDSPECTRSQRRAGSVRGFVSTTLGALGFLGVCIGGAAAEPQQGRTGASAKPDIGATKIKIGGFVKADAVLSKFGGGSLASGNVGRDFYIPSLIPVGGDDSDFVIDFNPRETRVYLQATNDSGSVPIKAYIELDFQVTSGGDERVSNSFTPRLRSAYVSFGSWLIGQNWSTFQDVSALPENLDFVGPAESTIFARQPMIRYSYENFEFALEQPETLISTPSALDSTIKPVDAPSPSRVIFGDDFLPDAIARYTLKGDWGHLRAAAILRFLRVAEGRIGEDSVDEIGYGVSLTGKINIGSTGDDFRFALNAGEGIGRYLGVNLVNDATYDGNGDLETIGVLSGYMSYRHVWNSAWRSNLTVGYATTDHNVDLTGMRVTKDVYSVHANVIYKFSDKVDVGVEYVYAKRTLEVDSVDGDLNRLIFSAKIAF